MNDHMTLFLRLVERHRERMELLGSGKGSDALLAPQARALLLLAQGFSPREASFATGLGTTRIDHFRRRFLRLGLPGLCDAPPLTRTRTLQHSDAA